MAVITHLGQPAGQGGSGGIAQADLGTVAQPLQLCAAAEFGLERLLQLRARIGAIALRLLAQ
ncbi:hypothetical protein D3C77_776830 [compost metagenome]